MKKLTIALAVLILSGCAALGVPVPQTFNQKALVAYNGATALVTTVTNLDAAGVITDADAKNVAAQADNVKAGIEIARQAEAAVAGSGGTKLDAAVAILTAAQTYLCSKQPKGAGGCP